MERLDIIQTLVSKLTTLLLNIDEDKLSNKLELLQLIVDDEELGIAKLVNTTTLPKKVLGDTKLVDVTQKRLPVDINKTCLDIPTLQVDNI